MSEKCRISVNSDKQCQNNKKYDIFHFKYQYSHEPDRYRFIVLLNLENITLDTLFVHLRRLVFKLRTQIRSGRFEQSW